MLVKWSPCTRANTEIALLSALPCLLLLHRVSHPLFKFISQTIYDTARGQLPCHNMLEKKVCRCSGKTMG